MTRTARAPSPITAVIDHAGGRASWLALMPITGRTHQLRAHCAALGTPILGDGKYGGGRRPSRRRRRGERAAPARPQPRDPEPHGGVLRVTAPLPPHMRETWEFFGFAGDAADPFAELEATA